MFCRLYVGLGLGLLERQISFAKVLRGDELEYRYGEEERNYFGGALLDYEDTWTGMGIPIFQRRHARSLVC
ncbi:hypothetical protein BJX64DRAFT_273083 [Aspergillus heterothallicus]